MGGAEWLKDTVVYYYCPSQCGLLLVSLFVGSLLVIDILFIISDSLVAISWRRAGLEVMKFVSCSAYLSMKLQMLRSIKISRTIAFFQTQIKVYHIPQLKFQMLELIMYIWYVYLSDLSAVCWGKWSTDKSRMLFSCSKMLKCHQLLAF